jgi:hypothetical protein
MKTNNQSNQSVVTTVLVAGINSVFTNTSTTGSGSVKVKQDGGDYLITGVGDLALIGKNDTNYNKLLNATDAGAATKVALIQGTGNYVTSALSGAGYEKPFLSSGVINRKFPVRFQPATLVKNPVFNTVALTDVEGKDEMTYSVTVNQTGIRLQQANSIEMRDSATASYTSLDYSTLGYSTVEATSDVISAIGYKFNLNSQLVKYAPAFYGNQPYVVLGINIDGTGTGSTISSLITSTATRLEFQETTDAGVTTSHYLPLSVDLREAFAQFPSSGNGILSTSKVIPITRNTSDAWFGKINALLFVALNSGEAVVYDEEKFVKTQILVSADAMNSASRKITKMTSSYEGQGQGKKWLITWKNYAKANVYTGQQFGDVRSLVQIPDYVNVDYQYQVYVIEHGDEDHNFTPHEDMYYRTFVLIPSAIKLSITGSSAGTNAEAYAYLDKYGKVISVQLVNGGSSYSGTATVSIPTLCNIGTGFSATATIASGAVTSLSLVSGGSNYTTAPIGSTQALGANQPIVKGLTTYFKPFLDAVSDKEDYTSASF